MTLHEKTTIKFLIEISLLEVYKMEKICGSVLVKKTGAIKCFSCLTGNLNLVYNQQGTKKQKEGVDGKEVYGTQ